MPPKLLVRSPKGGSKPTGLLHGTSVFDMQLEVPPAADMTRLNGPRVYNLPAALLGCSQMQFAAHPAEMRSALAMVTDASDVLSRLLAGGHSTIAGRLAGAFRNIGRERIAGDIIGAMQAPGYTVNTSDPFEDQSHFVFSPRDTSPYVTDADELGKDA